MYPPFLVVPHVIHGGCRLAVQGEIDLQTAPQVEAMLDRHAVAGRVVHLDLTRVSFLDSSGIHLLVAARRRAEAEGFRLRVRLPRSEAARRALEVCCVDELLRA